MACLLSGAEDMAEASQVRMEVFQAEQAAVSAAAPRGSMADFLGHVMDLLVHPDIRDLDLLDLLDLGRTCHRIQ